MLGLVMSRAIATAIVTLAALGAFVATAPAASAATLGGTAFKDLNRDGVWQTSEPLLADQEIHLYAPDGPYLARAITDAFGHYVFSDLVDGNYRVAFDTPSWWALRQDWVPSTSVSLRASRSVSVSGTATVDFGWRPIVRSTDPSAPISTYTGPSGLRVSSYDDVVTARELYDALASDLIGPEAPYTEVRFDLGASSMTSLSAAQSNGGPYSSYSATSYVSYLSWLDSGDRTLTHEYGHAWSMYNAFIVQQDPDLTAYLKARGLFGDPRVNSTYAWQAREMIAEDYRQLFGSANARSGGQTNTDVPPASDVPGLASFLANTFTTAPAPASPPPPPPPPASTGAPAISGSVSQGATLTASTGTWSGSPVSYAYEWQRCDSAGANCSPVSGQTASSYVLASGDSGFTMRVAVTASNSAGSSAPATSAPTIVVPAPAPPPPPAPPKLTTLGMNPDPVRTTGTVSFLVSAPASLTVRIFTAKGALVRTLLSSALKPAGAVDLSWDRADAAGRRVGKGTYRVQVDAVDSASQSASASATFGVA